jgi:crotonobetainyl-CoA:carnitine CoA-transferase CaiB-like acyl-CoA transferase
MPAPDPADVLTGLWRAAGFDDASLRDVTFTGSEPVLPSSFAVGTAAQATIGAAALAAADLWRLRTGRRQGVRVDMRNAAIEFRSERYLHVDGKAPHDHHDPIAGLYRCGDGRWARLHTNLPHHCSGLLHLLGCDHDREAVERALDGWRAEALEDAAADAGLVVTACRSFAEWDRHPQGRAIAQLPLFSIEKIGDAPPKRLRPAERPLSGVKVLDLTRIIAGPVCGRTLAAHGADVLLVTASHLASMLPLVIDTGRGKLSAAIDLRETDGRRTLSAQVPDADVFVEGYRPGALAARGFGPHDEIGRAHV